VTLLGLGTGSCFPVKSVSGSSCDITATLSRPASGDGCREAGRVQPGSPFTMLCCEEAALLS
jgi:hypothetical protein